MSTDKLFSKLVRADDGAWSTVYGSFVIKSALQPIFRIAEGNALEMDGLQGLIRPQRDGDSFSPGEFLPLVEAADRPALQGLMRSIHILNAGQLRRDDLSVFVSFDPRLYDDERALRHEIDLMRHSAREARLSPGRIVCELSGRTGQTTHTLEYYAARLRGSGFRISISDYGSGEMDADSASALKPDFIKFDSPWVRDYMTNPAGFALLRVIVRQFRDKGMQPVFDRLEEAWQVDFCRALGVPLLQGYALARPQLAPTDFNERFSTLPSPPDGGRPNRGSENPLLMSHRDRSTFGSRPFGRRYQ